MNVAYVRAQYKYLDFLQSISCERISRQATTFSDVYTETSATCFLFVWSSSVTGESSYFGFSLPRIASLVKTTLATSEPGISNIVSKRMLS